MTLSIRGLALSLVASGIACGGEANKSAPAPEPVKKVETVAASVGRDAGTVVSAPYVYTYSPIGKRDPFRSMVDEIRLPSADNGACKEPLCQWELDQLTLVGVITGEANPVAMVEDPQGRGYVIRRNTRMGKQGGKVTQILRDSVTVTELWTAPDGKVTPNPVSVHLKPDKVETPVVDLSTGKQY